jgi:hypothetical protein
LKKYWTGIALALGPAVLISTILWEIARTNPTYAFLVNPWSIKGHETVHGWVFVWLGAALLVGGMLVLWERSTSGVVRLAVLSYFVVVGTALVAGFARDQTSVTVGTMLGVAIALFVALIVLRFSRSTVAKAVPFMGRGWVQAMLLIVIWAITFVILTATLIDKRLTMNSWVAMFGLLVLLAVYASAAVPRGLAANRLLIYTSILAILTVVTSAGAIRSTLLRLQREAEGFGAEYRDVQVGLGWFVGVFGMAILFAGAVGLWARRQDLLVALTRARRQREAAEKSAAEIGAAEEAYLAESRNTSDV